MYEYINITVYIVRFRNRGSGLKGDVGNWVLEELANCTAVKRVR